MNAPKNARGWCWFIEQIVDCDTRDEADAMAAFLRTQDGCYGARVLERGDLFVVQAAHATDDGIGGPLPVGMTRRYAPPAFFRELERAGEEASKR